MFGRCIMEITDILGAATHISDPVLLEKLSGLARIRRLKKGDISLKTGEMQTKIHLLIDGVMRCYYLDGSGRETTDCFIIQPGYPVMTASLSIPSLITAQAVTATRLLELPLKPVMALMQEYPELLWAYNEILQKVLFFHWEIKTSYFGYSALERYLWFRKNWPGVEEVANSRHIASFLGMTPETLSRMRRMARDGGQVHELLSDPNSDWDASGIKRVLDHHGRQDGRSIDERI